MDEHEIAKDIHLHQEFGLLTVTGVASTTDASGCYRIECECKCGKKCEIARSSLRSGKTRSCGCQLKNYYQLRRSQMALQFMIGQRYGLLEPTGLAGTDRQGNRQVVAKCHGCETRKKYIAINLRNGRSKTCGKSQCVAHYHKAQAEEEWADVG